MVNPEENDQQMLSKSLNYISHHAIAILALICSLLALAGASYAALKLPKNSVGNRQIKRGAVAPPKFSKQIGGYVRMYAKISAAGQVIYSRPEANVIVWRTAGPAPGGTIGWKPSASSRCAPLVTPEDPAGPESVSADLGGGRGSGDQTQVYVNLSSAAGATVAVVCPTPK